MSAARGSRSRSRGRWVAVLGLGVVMAACTGAVTGPSGESGGSSGVVASPASPVASRGTAAAPTTAATAETAALGTSASPSGTPVATTGDGPPAAHLSVDGGDPVTGQLGSFTWAGSGSDSPWLPGTPIAVGRGERLSMLLDPATAIGDWSVRRRSLGTAAGTATVGVADGRGLPMGFPAPPPGRWSVQVTTTFGPGIGSATWYWQVDVR